MANAECRRDAVHRRGHPDASARSRHHTVGMNVLDPATSGGATAATTSLGVSVAGDAIGALAQDVANLCSMQSGAIDVAFSDPAATSWGDRGGDDRCFGDW